MTCIVGSPHPVWTTSASSSFECRKASIHARMMSGRFRTEYMCRHWSKNKMGFCLAETCEQKIGDLEHLLLHCPALSALRERLWDMLFEHSVQYPALYHFLLQLENFPPNLKMQFLIDPTAFHEVVEFFQIIGQQAINHVFYLIRTYNYYLYRQMQILLGYWPGDQIKVKKYKKHSKRSKHQTIKNDSYSSFNFPIIAGHPVMPTSVQFQAHGSCFLDSMTDYPLTVSNKLPAVPSIRLEPVVSALPTLHPASLPLSVFSDQSDQLCDKLCDQRCDQQCDGSSYCVVTPNTIRNDFSSSSLQTPQFVFPYFRQVPGQSYSIVSNILKTSPVSQKDDSVTLLEHANVCKTSVDSQPLVTYQPHSPL